MGKYMKKGKITGDVAVMEVPQSAGTLGVRTRARTLALQPNPELSYLQLRNRRLEKPQFLVPSLPKQEKVKQQGNSCSPNPKSNSRLRVNGSMISDSFSVSNNSRRNEERRIGSRKAAAEAVATAAEKNSWGSGAEAEKGVGGGASDLGVEASFGENNLDHDGVERTTRESTPCSFIRDVDAMGTPCSAVRPTCSSAANQRVRNTVHRLIPTAQEMEEFFADAEQQQRKLFMDKYNFDIVNDSPLPGRYEWETVHH